MNIAEILKYCQTGMKLYSSIHGEVEFICVNKYDEKYPIKCKDESKYEILFTSDGRVFYNYTNTECVLFLSKIQRDWSKFRIPIKKGDIMMNIDGTSPFIATGEMYHDISPKYICGINSSGEFTKYPGKGGWTTDFYIPASKEAKKKLFDKIKEAGYTWNADTLELDKMENKLKKQEFKQFKQDFKPFDKVLVRNDANKKWSINLFSYYDEEDKLFPYVCLDGCYHYCIPYEDYNKHVLGTTINPNK